MIVLMANKSEDQQAEFFAKSFREVVIPVLEDMEERLASKKDLEVINKSLTGVEGTLDSLDRKFDAQQERLDRHDKRISHVEQKAGIAN